MIAGGAALPCQLGSHAMYCVIYMRVGSLYVDYQVHNSSEETAWFQDYDVPVGVEHTFQSSSQYSAFPYILYHSQVPVSMTVHSEDHEHLTVTVGRTSRSLNITLHLATCMVSE